MKMLLCITSQRLQNPFKGWFPVKTYFKNKIGLDFHKSNVQFHVIWRWKNIYIFVLVPVNSIFLNQHCFFVFLKDAPKRKDVIFQYIACYWEGAVKDSYSALIRKEASGNDSASPATAMWQTTLQFRLLPSVFWSASYTVCQKKSSHAAH